jgi:hypothetical protein
MIYTNLHRSLHKKAKVLPSVARPATTSARRPTAGQNIVVSTPKRGFRTSPTHFETSDDDAEQFGSVPAASAYDCLSIIACSHNDSHFFFSVVVFGHILQVCRRAMFLKRPLVQLGQFGLTMWAVNFDLPNLRVKPILVHIILGMDLV